MSYLKLGSTPDVYVIIPRVDGSYANHRAPCFPSTNTASLETHVAQVCSRRTAGLLDSSHPRVSPTYKTPLHGGSHTTISMKSETTKYRRDRPPCVPQPAEEAHEPSLAPLCRLSAPVRGASKVDGSPFHVFSKSVLSAATRELADELVSTIR